MVHISPASRLQEAVKAYLVNLRALLPYLFINSRSPCRRESIVRKPENAMLRFMEQVVCLLCLFLAVNVIR